MRIVCLIIVCHLGFLNEQVVGQSFLMQHTAAELKVGDTMPDILLGEVINNNTGKTRFSEFKSKLVILDFWSTYCGACLSLMPHMSELQKEFKDSIQIFLVNPRETNEEIQKRLSKLKLSLPANLPCIVAANKLDTLFTTPEGHPHHVWIDGNGIVRVRSSSMGTYPEKIRDILAGRDICDMKDDNTTASFSKEKPYYKVLGLSGEPFVPYGSFFTTHNNEYAALNGGIARNMVDSFKGIVRNTFVNKEIIKLYASVYEDSLEKSCEKEIFNSNILISPVNAYFLLYVKDTSRYTFDYIEKDFFSNNMKNTDYADRVFIKSRFCYEQITPAGISDSQRKSLMWDDLNRYFYDLYGMKASLEKIRIPCYVLVRTRTERKLISSSKGDGYLAREIIRNGKNCIQSVNRPLKGVFAEVVSSKLFHESFPVVLIDETNISGNIDIILPGRDEISDLNDLLRYIRPYGLDIIHTERKVLRIVFREETKR